LARQDRLEGFPAGGHRLAGGVRPRSGETKGHLAAADVAVRDDVAHLYRRDDVGHLEKIGVGALHLLHLFRSSNRGSFVDR
jgi:hypothetical protein